jgi:hypothetical protein
MAVLALDCSLVLDWNNYTGGDANAGGGVGSDVGADDASPAQTGDADPNAGEAGSLGAPCGSDRRCEPPPPTPDWSGPVELYVGPASDPLPPCGAGYSSASVFDGYRGMSFAAASCSPCGCSAPQGGACSPAPVTFYSDPSCAAPCGAGDASLTTTTCAATAGCTNFQVGPSTPTRMGGCMPEGGAPTYDAAVSWAQVARACMPEATASGSCGGGQLCVPSPAGAFPPRVCILKAGDTSCPGLPYINRIVFYTSDVVDTRACSNCSCEAPSGVSCSFPAAFPLPGFRYADSLCAIPNVPFGVPSSCQVVMGASGLKLATPPVLDAGACPTSGGEPDGSVVPAAAETFCCTP